MLGSSYWSDKSATDTKLVYELRPQVGKVEPFLWPVVKI